jgi:hypothetical protein
MTKNFIFSAIFAAACLIGGGASAQTAGSFAGQTEDGNLISVTVTQSGSTFTVTGMSVGMTGACKKTGLTVNEGWGFFSGADISSGQTDFSNGNDYYYFVGSMHFSGHTVIKGTITGYTATFVPGATPPAQAQFCTSHVQGFTMTKQAPAKPVALPSNVDTGRLKPRR